MEKTELRVLIYPFIPDLNNDGLKSLRDFIKKEFEDGHPDITLHVDGDPSVHDPYSTDNLKTYLGTTGYDVVEVDTILLGEMVKLNLVEPHIPLDDSSFLRFAVDAVRYKGLVYGIPTLVCANFLAAMTSENGKDDAVNLIGSFRGSWTLPGHYLNAYINIYGASSMDDGVLSNPPEHSDVLNSILHFSDTCVREDGSNPCTNKTYKDNTNAQINDVIKSKSSNFLAYSEVIGQSLFTDPSLKVTSVKVPPFGDAGYLPMYTDALVANRNTYKAKKNAIQTFMAFYTSEDFRYKYAFCGDMEIQCIRYVLPACSAFYKNTLVQRNSFYTQLYDVMMTSGTAGPNHEIYYKKDCLDGSISTQLKYPPLI